MLDILFCNFDIVRNLTSHTMKKLFGLLLILGFFAFTTACGGEKKAEEGENTETTEQVTPDNETPSVPEADTTAAEGEGAGVE